MSPDTRLGGCGLSDGEAHIMALWDGGRHGIESIAESTGYPATYVQEVVTRYTVTSTRHDPFNRMSANGTAALLAALHRVHPETQNRVHP